MADQGAGRNAGQAAGGRFVQFSRGAAQRIANVVRTVEAGDRSQPGITFDHPTPSGGKIFRVATFTGSWSIGSSKTVTFKYQTTTPNTAAAVNLFWPISGDGTRDCAIAKDGTAWHLLVPQLYAANAATAAVITTAAIEFKTLPVAALASSGTATFTLSITTCATA
jgi:hypothetical protein